MPKVAVVDIETTGTNINKDLILEIGIVELNLDNGSIKEIFNSFVREPNFNHKYYDSWIFEKRYINIEDIEKAKELNEVFREVQKILNQYKVTAFNKKFDFDFLRSKGFSIPKEFPCIMLMSARIISKLNLSAGDKWPSLKEAYKQILPQRLFDEKHRALYDAQVEAELLYEIYSKGEFVEMEFSRDLADVYRNYAEKPYDMNNITEGFEHNPQSSDDAYHYLVTKFPLHYPKSRKMLKDMNCLPLGCGKVIIIDFGCGPFTFTIGFLDEIINDIINYGGGSYDIRILGIDKSYYSLTLGSDLLDSYKKKIEHLGILIEYKIIYDDGDFDDIVNQIYEWLNVNHGHYIYLAYSASMSSGIRNFINIIQTLTQFSTNAILNAFVIEPDKYSSGLKVESLQIDFPDLSITKIQFDASCKKPIGMVHKYKSIYSNFHAIILQNYNKYIVELLKNSGFYDNFEESILIFNKLKRWVLYERLVDYVGINLLENEIKYTFFMLKNVLPNLKMQRFLIYKVQKGLFPDKYRNMTLINFPYIALSMIMLKVIGKTLDDCLSDKIYCSRICNINRLDRFYKFFTIGYTDFSNFELRREFEGKLLCTADIKDYFDSIDRNLLKRRLSEIFEDCNIRKEYIPIVIKSLGNQKGIPIGSPLSSLIANLYLIQIDKEILNHAQVLDYARYMDDLKIILDTKKEKVIEEEFKVFLKKTLNLHNLVLSEDKFKVSKIDNAAVKYKYNRYFKSLTDEYFDLINPIKYSLCLLLYNLKKNSIKVDKNYSQLVNPISNVLNNIGITFGSDALYRYLILINRKLKDPDFEVEINEFRKEKVIELVFPKKILEYDETELSNQFIYESRIWIIKCLSFTRKIYNFLLKELSKWDNLQENLDLLDSGVPKEKQEELLIYKKTVLESEEFLYSIRMIKYLIYRLTRIKYYKLYYDSNKVIKLVMKLIRLYFPIKLIGLLLFRYNHIAKLKDLLDKSIERFEEKDEVVSRKIYPNDISYLIHLLGLYYEKNENELAKDFEFWIKKINIILISRPYEEKLAITEFILRLNLINQIPYSKWISWYKQSDNYLC